MRWLCRFFRRRRQVGVLLLEQDTCEYDAAPQVRILRRDESVREVRQWHRAIFTERLRLSGRTTHLDAWYGDKWWPGTQTIRHG